MASVGQYSAMEPGSPLPARRNAHWPEARCACCMWWVTITIVTHNMQQAQRVSNQCAFFLAGKGEPGSIVEYGPTDAMFEDPQDPRTADYVHGRFG